MLVKIAFQIGASDNKDFEDHKSRWNKIWISSFDFRLNYLGKIIEACHNLNVFWYIFLPKWYYIFRLLVLKSRNLLSGMNIEFFCAREIEKQSERMTTTIKGNFFYVSNKIPRDRCCHSRRLFFYFEGTETLYMKPKRK